VYPYYLLNFVCEPHHYPDFEDAELLYHRSGSEKPAEYFEGLNTRRLQEGLSLNRSKLSPFPNDVLWAPVADKQDENGKILLEYKSNYSVYQLKALDLANLSSPREAKLCAIKLALEFDPCEHNLAHSLLIINNLDWESLSKSEKKALRLYIASLFVKIS
jgi:hypothetical protein